MKQAWPSISIFVYCVPTVVFLTLSNVVTPCRKRGDVFELLVIPAQHNHSIGTRMWASAGVKRRISMSDPRERIDCGRHVATPLYKQDFDSKDD